MEVKIELGHKAWKNIKLTKEGYTHDWTVFLQGVNGNEIKHIVEKVIFHLPDSYPDPNRIKENPPYVLSESSSQSLSIHIDVFFCPEAKLRKVHYMYDIFISDEEVNMSWERKLAFPNPSTEFKEKLLLAGGEIIDLLKAFPVMTGEFLKIKEEPIDEIVNIADEALLNTGVQKSDNFENKRSTDSERQLRFNELLKENKNLKKANIEIKEKVNLQEKFRDYYKENCSRYESNILKTNLSINKLKKKIEADEQEITTLKLKLQMLQVKMKMIQIQNSSPDLSEKRTRGTKRKNEEDLNVSAAVRKEKENVSQSTQFLSLYSSTSQNSLKNAFASIENQNFCESVKSKSDISVVLNASENKPAFEPNDLCNILSKNGLPSHLNNETQSLNDSSSNQQNLYKNQDFETLDCSSNISSAIALSFKSATNFDVEKSIAENTDKVGALKKLNKDVEKSIEGNTDKVGALKKLKNDVEKYIEGNTDKVGALKKFNNDVEKSVNQSSVKVNSLNTPEIIIDAEISAKANASFDIPEIIVIDDDESEKGMSPKADASLNELDTRHNAIEKPMYENSVEGNSLNTPKIKVDFVKSAKGKNSVNAKTTMNKTQKKFGTPIQEHHVSSTKRTNMNSSNLKCKQKNKLSNFSGVVISSPTSSSVKLSKKKKPRKERNILKSNSPQTLASVKNLGIVSCGTNKKKSQHSSKIERTTSNSSNSNCKKNGKKIDNVSSSLTPSNTKLPKRKRKNSRNVFPSEISISSICKQSDQNSNDTSVPMFISFLTEHCLKLVAELDRIKNSEFRKYREGANALFHKLENIDSNQIPNERFFEYVQTLINYFSDPKAMDMPSLIYLVVDYLYQDRIQHLNLPTYIRNKDICVYLAPSENCIVHALFEVERKKLPHLNGLISNTLCIMHQVIVSKKKMAPNGLASLCRVFMEICKCKNDRWEPLFLCCELLRLGHPLAPYLIISLAAVWRDPFRLYDNFSVEENMVLGSINYGMKDKPLLMDYGLWNLTVRLKSTYFPRPFIIAPQQAVQFLTTEIFSRCVGGLFQDIWMLASPLLIYISNETWEWKMDLRKGYLLPKLQHFSTCSNEQGFGLFCNLLVDIFSFCSESPYEQILQYFANHSLHRGVKFIQDCAAVALLKYFGVTDKQIPARLRDWFLRNQDNPKLEVLIELYCKKVMESRNYFLLWDDIIIVK